MLFFMTNAKYLYKNLILVNQQFLSTVKLSVMSNI